MNHRLHDPIERFTPDAAAGGSPRMVTCAKLGRELRGLDEKPYPNELGERIYASERCARLMAGDALIDEISA